jgi:hypothetical protein
MWKYELEFASARSDYLNQAKIIIVACFFT